MNPVPSVGPDGWPRLGLQPAASASRATSSQATFYSGARIRPAFWRSPKPLATGAAPAPARSAGQTHPADYVDAEPVEKSAEGANPPPPPRPCRSPAGRG